MVFATTSASSASPGHAVAAKKRCKKKHSRASAAKKCKKKKSVPTPVVTPPPPPPPTPLALTDSEVINQVSQKAHDYCDVDLYCFDWGYYYDSNPSEAYCTSKTTYSWSCLGYNLEDNGVDPEYVCDFREIVERVGYNGITSHQDLTYGDNGWDCYTI
jgi:hypothetical protein